MDPPPDLVTLASLITLSRQYTCSSMKASTALSPCQPLGQRGNAKPPSLTTSGGISETQPKAATNRTFLFCSSPAVTSTVTAASPSSQPSAPATSTAPQPMDNEHGPSSWSLLHL